MGEYANEVLDLRPNHASKESDSVSMALKYLCSACLFFVLFSAIDKFFVLASKFENIIYFALILLIF